MTHGRQRENDFSGYTGYRAAGEVETCLTVSYRVLSLWPVLLVHLILPIFVHFSSPGPHSRSQRCICNCNVHMQMQTNTQTHRLKHKWKWFCAQTTPRHQIPPNNCWGPLLSQIQHQAGLLEVLTQQVLNWKCSTPLLAPSHPTYSYVHPSEMAFIYCTN